MTLPRDERTENIRLALTRMLERVADEPVDEVFLIPKEFDGILTTTWEELQARNFVETVSPAGEVSLTGRGWIAALLLTGKNSEEDFKQCIERLFATMKGYVKGRKEPKPVSMRMLVEETKLPEGWIFNIVEGKYMEEICKRKGASWAKKGRVVLIPMGFGVEPTDLQALLNADLVRRVEELQEDLEITQDELGQYRCPYCGAALSSAASVELDEHSDGYYQSFECGYAVLDGYPETLCPSDPKFPTLEDFDLQVHKTKYENEWICTPVPKTPHARKVDLYPQPGRTEEEARQRVIEWYNYIMKSRRR